MKELIVQLFGEYEPIMTSAIMTETVDGVTTSHIIDVVASGSAGVDWAWVAGVFLFSIVLYSAFRVLGVFVK